MSTEKSVQNGVLKVELAHRQWTMRGLFVAYTALFVTTFMHYLEIYSTIIYHPFVTSAFGDHSLLTTAGIVQNIADAAAYPVVAKLSDVFGRAEGLSLSIFFAVLANALAAASQNIETFVTSNIFEAMGSAGFRVMQQVFIADTTRVVNRGIWASLVEALSVIPVLYLGTMIGERMLEVSTWRWGYGIWSIILPVTAAPLIITLVVYQRRSKAEAGDRRLGVLSGLPTSATLLQKIHHVVWIELDILGIFLLVAGLSLTLIPLSITGPYNSYRWGNAATIVMIVWGIALLVAFFAWDAKFAKRPLFSRGMIKDSTLVAACVLVFVEWIGYSASGTFLTSYLQVVGGYAPGHATRIYNATRVTWQIGSVFVGLLMRWTKRSQPFVLAGVPIAVLGQGLLIYIVNVDGVGIGSETALVASRVLCGLGRAFFATAAQVSIQASVMQQEVAVATGIFLAATSVGSSIGRSIAGAVWNEYLPSKLEQYLPEEALPEVPQIFGSIVTAMDFPEGEPIREAINRSYRETQQMLTICATTITAIMLIVMFFLRNINLSDADVSRQQQLDSEFLLPRKSVADSTVTEEKQEAERIGMSMKEPEPERPAIIMRDAEAEERRKEAQ